ncbi:hypothetical protein ScPMuIL_000424 [Solemya velum]
MSTKKTNSYKNPRNSESEDNTRAQWSTQSYTLEELLGQFTLPQIAKCNPLSILVKRENPFPVNLTQPLLLFDSKTVRKLLARNVVFDHATQKYSESDETIIIPSDYEGMFLRLRSRTAKDQTTHKIIQSLANHNIKAFMNMTRLTGFRVDPNNEKEYSKIEYIPGNVFLVAGLHMGTAKIMKDAKALNIKASSQQEVQYLRCRDEKNVEIVIPTFLQGEFIEVLPSPVQEGKYGVTSEHIIKAQNFPVVVRYLHGRYSPRLVSFSGLFTLLDSFEETTVVGCVLDRYGFTLIEIPQSSPLTFQLALNSRDLFGHPVVKKALQLCQVKGAAFARDLKFKFKFVQRVLTTWRHASINSRMSDTSNYSGPTSANDSARLGLTTTHIYL